MRRVVGGDSTIAVMKQPAGDSSQPNTPDTPVRVAVCAATFRRPVGLERLLDGLAAQQFDDNPPSVSLVIVDNDPQAGAQATVEAKRSAMPWPVQYVHEPSPGIVAARNAALDAVDPNAELICFIDDDEAPHPDWLQNLILAQQRTRADVVTGPVDVVYEPGVPNWVIAGGFFQRRKPAEDQRLPYAATNNVLFRADMLRKLNLRFDSRFQPMGEDHALFQQIAMSGGRIVWAGDAVVSEWIPAHRATARWLIRRMYLVGRSMTRIEITLRGGFPIGLVQAAKGIVWVGIGLLTLLGGVLARRWAVRSLRWIAYGAGLIRGTF